MMPPAGQAPFVHAPVVHPATHVSGKKAPLVIVLAKKKSMNPSQPSLVGLRIRTLSNAWKHAVYTRDSALLATAMLKRYSPTSAELGCLVVDPAYRKQGRGDAMLSFIERTAIAAGVTEIFALSTRTMQWCEPTASYPRPGSAPRTARRPLTAAAAPRAQVCRARLQERAARRIARAPAEALPAGAQLEGVPQGPRAGRPRRRRRGALLGAGRRRVVQLRGGGRGRTESPSRAAGAALSAPPLPRD